LDQAVFASSELALSGGGARNLFSVSRLLAATPLESLQCAVDAATS